tara:strand:+ start:605 stop:1420 length:816 start_codon:yes stop_codon:yes gene_type:complete
MFGIINYKLFKMKKLFLVILGIAPLVMNAQDFSKVYRHVEEITLNDGLKEEYVNFEGFWKTVKDKHVKEGMQLGWFVWKVMPAKKSQNWADYLILNIFANEQQMKQMNSKPVEWWKNEIKSAHKGKTKRAVVKKYIQETLDNKYRKKSVSYTNKGIDAFIAEGANPSAGTKGRYIGMEQLNEDYVDFETKLFAPFHKKYKSRLYWELNEIIDRTENAYKPVTHIIFEIINPDRPELERNPTFAEQMAIKYGIASRKLHGSMNVELVHFSWQ